MGPSQMRDDVGSAYPCTGIIFAELFRLMATVFMAELHAIDLAVQCIQLKLHCSVMIYVNSLSAIKVLLCMLG